MPPSIFTIGQRLTKGFFSGAKGIAGAGLSAGKEAVFGSTASSMIAGTVIGGITGASQGYDLNSTIEGAARGAVLGGAAGGVFGVAKTGVRGIGKLPKAYWENAERRTIARTPFGTSVSKKEIMKEAIINRPMQMAKNIASDASFVGKGIGKAALFGIEHPLLTGGVAAVGIGSIALARKSNASNLQSMTSPTLEGASVKTNYNEQALAAQRMGQIGSGSFGSAEQMGQQFQNANWMEQVGSLAMNNTRTGRFAQSASGLTFGLHEGRHG